MPEQSVSQLPGWLKPATALAIVTAAAATAFGVWFYTEGGAAVSSGPAAGTAPDAVQTALRAGKPTVIEFGANSCVSCREMKPILRTLALDPRMTVADIDILKERSYISRYQIRLMPTQVFYNAEGIETGRHMGKISADAILANLGLAPSTATPTAVATRAGL